MNFNFNEEQTMIQRQVSQFIQRDYEWEKRQSLASSDLGFSEDNWNTFAELGWLGISISEKFFLYLFYKIEQSLLEAKK